MPGCMQWFKGWAGRQGVCGGIALAFFRVTAAMTAMTAMVAGTLAPVRCEAASFSPSEKLLPESTRVWVSVADPQALRKRFEQSSLGGLVYDPLMSTFLDGLRQQGKASADPLRGTLEITFEEVEQIAGGEIALGVIERPDGLLATVALIDTSGHENAVQPVVDALLERVAAKGGKALATPPQNTALIKAFTIPVAAADAGKTAQASEARGIPAGEAKRGTPGGQVTTRQLAIRVTPGILIIGDKYDAVSDVAATLDTTNDTTLAAGNPVGSLASLPAFAKVAKRCTTGVPATAATVRWFLDPLAYLAADRRTHPPKKNRKGPDYVAILRRQGFDAVSGVGGCLFYGEGDVDLRHNTLIHAPPQNGRPVDGPGRFQKAARMLCFPNVTDLSPAAWVPGSAASWTSFQWDIANAFDSMQPLVDDIVGEEGVFDDVIASLKEDPDGPQIDVRGDLIRHLGGRCVVASDHETPLEPDCERMLIALETSDAEAVAAILAKGMMSEAGVRKVDSGGHVIWETVKPAAAQGPAPEAGGDDAADDAAVRRRARQRERRDQDKDSVWPNLSVAVAHGHVFVASHRDFLERVLANGTSSSVAQDDSFKAVATELKELLGDERALSSFHRTERLVRPAYELLRAGRLPESKSLAGTLLTRLFDNDPQQAGKRQDAGPRKQQIDGSSLPEFEQIRQYFGVSGMSMQSTPDGFYLVGVGLWNGKKLAAAGPASK